MAGAEGEKKLITLRSSDGDEFEVEEVVAMESQIIRHMIEDDCADNGIPLPNVNSKILSRVIEYYNKHVWATADSSEDCLNRNARAENLENWDAEFVKVDQSTLLGLIMAAEYLDVKGLLDLTCESVVDMIRSNRRGGGPVAFRLERSSRTLRRRYELN